MAARLTTYLVVAIVACTLIAGLIVGAQRGDSDGPVDVIVYNAVVYTADGSGDKAEAVAIRGNQILGVGSEREINRLRRPQTTLIDAHGAAVLPGFNDASLAFIDGGLALDRIDLAGARSLDEVQARVHTWAEGHPDRPIVVGGGWDATLDWDPRPTRGVLDLVVEDRPVVLLAGEGIAAWVNTKALQVAGITRRTADPEGGVIVRDTRTNEASGVLQGSAVALVRKLLPRPTRADRARALRAAIAEAHSNGITSVQHVGASVEDLELYDEARRAGDLDLRVYSAVNVTATPQDAELARLDVLSSKYPDDPFFKTGAASISVDGTLASRTAALLEPYAGSTIAGDTLVSPDALNRAVRILDAHGWQVIAHASGDRSVAMALDAFHHAARSNPSVARGRRHRVDGLVLAQPRDIARFAALGAIASLLPFNTTPAETWMGSLGEDRAARVLPIAGLAEARARLAFGSGWPNGPLNPMERIHAAVTRGTLEDSTEPSGAAVPLGTAIDAATSGGAYASFDEKRKGTLEAGMLADLVVLSNDIFSAPPSRLRAATVAVTIFDGRIVYRRDRKTTN
jgi:predicted amidohydrolase YtcJ